MVAIDAGSLAMAVTPVQQRQIRDIVLTHAHLDHIAGLPLFIDDLFATLTEPIRVYGPTSVIATLERDVFNWSVYPRFSELSNSNGPVLEYKSFDPGEDLKVRHLTFRSIAVNHKVPAAGYIVSDGSARIAVSGDTAEMDGFWGLVNSYPEMSAILVECAFPNELDDLAQISHHLTPNRLGSDLAKCSIGSECPIYIVNMKPMYRDTIVDQLADLGMPNLHPLEVGKIYEW